jgi:hypothetical protein
MEAVSVLDVTETDLMLVTDAVVSATNATLAFVECIFTSESPSMEMCVPAVSNAGPSRGTSMRTVGPETDVVLVDEASETVPTPDLSAVAAAVTATLAVADSSVTSFTPDIETDDPPDTTTSAVKDFKETTCDTTDCS